MYRIPVSKRHREENEQKKTVFKKIQFQEGKMDISKKDPNIKTLNITTSLDPDKKKKGQIIEF